MSEYNYKHFNPKDYNFSDFKGPKAGEKYIDFQAKTLDGKDVSLSDYLDKPIVLETGSITCPMYANTSSPMNLLQEEYPDVNFLLLYIREAHPGKRTHATTDIDTKISNAISTKRLYNEKRTILVDNIEGTAHKLYGSMPNMIYVISKNKIIKFRANWSNVEALKNVLKNINDDTLQMKDYFDVIKPNPYTAIRTLLIGGFGALLEFLVELPQLMRQHEEAKKR